MPQTRRGLRLLEFTSEPLIVTDLVVATKAEALEGLVRLLAEARRLTDPEGVLSELLEREALMSTGIGDGVAVPHVRSTHLRLHSLVVAYCPAGIPFDAVDGRPVHFLFLTAGPASHAEVQVHLVSLIARMVRQTNLLDRFRAAPTAAEFLEALRVCEQEVK